MNGAYIANTGGNSLFSSGSNNMAAMYPQMVSTVGGSQPHENRQPFLTLSFCIALQGIYPSQN
jgi:microcystin-dependent protein